MESADRRPINQVNSEFVVPVGLCRSRSDLSCHQSACCL